MIKPRTMPGVMELLPHDQIAFQRMLDVIRKNYERFGFLPIETPVMEVSEVLLTKSGGMTERQVYFVQSTGSLQQGATPELALRFDLTVPLARYVAEHEHDLTFPFRRYQIQRVYRGERNQAGRFREFYQCDIDVIGKDALSPRYDAEIPAVIYALFSELAIGPFTIHLNNRKLMRGFFEGLGIVDGERHAAILREVDKLDKQGADAVRATLTGKLELTNDDVERILALVGTRSTSHADAIAKLEALSGGSPAMQEGVAELRAVLELVRALGVPEKYYMVNLSVARGLDYYTGTVYETTLDDYPKLGSICSGGRYENLAAHYTKSHLPGVGISIGATRLFYQLSAAKLLPAATSTTAALVALFDDGGLPTAVAIARDLRNAGINTEITVEPRKLAKQMQYADRAGIRFVVICGDDEAARGVVAIKDLRDGQQREVERGDLVVAMRAAIAAVPS